MIQYIIFGITLVIVVGFIFYLKGKNEKHDTDPQPDPIPDPIPDPEPKPKLKKAIVKRETAYPGYFCAAVVWENLGQAQIWAGTYTAEPTSKLYRHTLSGDTVEQETLVDLRAGESIYSLCECDDHSILIGTESGGYAKTTYLYLYKGGKFQEVHNLYNTSGIYALTHVGGISYAAYTDNHNGVKAYIYQSKDNKVWTRVWEKAGCQIKAGTSYNGCPQFFGYNFKSGYGLRVYFFKGAWHEQRLQKHTRYLDAFSEGGVCWLATSKFAETPDPENYMGAEKISGVAKLENAKILQVMHGKGEVGMSVMRSPYDEYLYALELNWKSHTKKAVIYRSLSGKIGSWEPYIITTEPELTDQVFLDNRHFVYTKNHSSHGKVLELI